MSLFSDFLEENGVDLEPLEPEEIRFLCQDPIFRVVARWCLERHKARPVARDDSIFDADELGLDPEDDDATIEFLECDDC